MTNFAGFRGVSTLTIPHNIVFECCVPNFYTCDGSSPDDCLVDLVGDSLDDLVSNSRTIEVSDDRDYEGVGVEFCGDSIGKSYNVYVKGTVTLGSTLYYTNADNGLSDTGPAEETAMDVECHGYTTALPEPVTLGPDKTVNIVLWTDPNAMVQAISYSPDGGSMDEGCANDADGKIGICTSFTTIFATVDDKQPAIERYTLDVTGTSSSNKAYSDLLVTVLFNSDDDPIAGAIAPIYPNTDSEGSYSALSFAAVEKASDNTLTFKTFNGDASDTVAILEDFPRETSTEVMSMTNDIGDKIKFTSTKLSE